MKKRKDNAASVLLLLSAVTAVGANNQEELFNGDRCAAFTTCAACTGAHYRYTQGGSIGEDQGLERIEQLSSRRFLRSSLSWPHGRPTCVWCPLDEICSSKSRPTECMSVYNVTETLKYEYDCPLGPDPYPEEPPSVLPNWMGALAESSGAFDKLTLVDLSLPGTHDSLTYDLSLTVSDDGLDQVKHIAQLLHTLSGGTIQLLPGELEEFFRLQAKTQQLTLTQQLDNGIRYLDIRIMMENDSKLWYSIHFMQSRKTIRHYWEEIRAWMDLHPEEVVVVWLSKHGSADATGDDQYPNVTPEEKQELWRNYAAIFDGLLLDTRVSSIYETPVAELIRRGHRLVTFASDYAEFTNSSPFALNGASIQNYHQGGGVFSEPSVMDSHMTYFQNGTTNNAAARAGSTFTLMSMNTEGTGWQVTDAAKERFLHWLGSLGTTETKNDVIESLFKSCAHHTGIPGLKHWCPQTLLDISQLTSFYNQIALESAYAMLESNPAVAFPNAFYLDALDYDGCLRTGTQTLYGAERSMSTASHKTSKYAYVDTVLAYNAQRACKAHQHPVGSCDTTFSSLVDERRFRHPLQRWHEPSYGRLINWPFL